MTLLGIIWVISEKNSLEPSNNNFSKLQGIMWGILAAVSQAGGAVLSRIGLLNSSITSLESSLIRLVAGTGIAFLLVMIPWKKKSSSQDYNFLSLQIIGVIILAAFGSTYLGIWLQQTSLKFASAGIAQTLLATSPIFAIIIAVIRKEKVTLRSSLGVFIAIIGISLLFFR